MGSQTKGEAASWAETVLAREPRIAVFDCDGTLWSGDAGSGFMQWSLRNGLVVRQAAEWLQARYREYGAGTVDEATICGEMVQVYAGLRENELRLAAARFFSEQMEPLIFPEMETLVRDLRSRGTEIWAVSSTSHWVIEAGVVERFGIPKQRVLAARVHVMDGIATDTLVAVPTDAAKSTALQAAGVAHPDAVFGNSIHDLAMLQLARYPYPVHPTGALLEQAELWGWPVFWPRASSLPLRAAGIVG